MRMFRQTFSAPLPEGPALARAVQLALAGLGIAVLVFGMYRLPQMGLNRNETTAGLLLLFVLSTQFLLAAMLFPLTNCLLRRGRHLQAELGAACNRSGR